MRKNFKKLLKIILLTVLIVSFTVPAYATSLDDAQQKKSQLEDNLDDAEKTLEDLESLKSDTYAYVTALDKSLDEINVQISDLQVQSNEKQKQINDAQALITEKQAKMDEQYASMKKRIQFMYENAETGYIDMILGSKNISDFLNKAEYLSQITQYDRNMISQLAGTKAEIEKTKAQLETDKADIETLKAEQKAKQNDIQVLSNEKNEQLEQYENEISVTKKKQKELQEEIAGQEKVIAQIKASVDNASGGYTGGMLLWPLNGYYTISSDYVNRIHPIFGYQELHDGIDIPAPVGTPIRAAYGGKVTISKLSSSAGNYIVIYHGNNLYTEYMHCNTRDVNVGDTVTQGQVIGTVGNTGWSTGAHLHFSVNVQTGSSFNTSDRVNPHPYLGR